MPGFVPESDSGSAATGPVDALGLALESLLEFTSAACGWIGLGDAATGVAFPVRRGAVPDAWLDYQRGPESIWGIDFRGGPTLLNHLPPWPGLGAALLRNLLSCPVPGHGDGRGYVVLANKPAGFTSHDAAVAQGTAHFIGKWVEAEKRPRREPSLLAALPPQVLDLAQEGIVVLDARGKLVFANATWAAWTGFAVEELLFQSAPFSFWAGHRQLASLGRAAEPRPGGALPFRRVDDSIFWCEVESGRMTWNGAEWTVAWLRRSAASTVSVSGPSSFSPAPALKVFVEGLPFPAVLTDQRGHTLVGNGAAQKLGLAAQSIFRDNFALASAAALEHLVRDPRTAERRLGRLALRGLADSSPPGWLACWLFIPSGAALPEGGFLFALTQHGESVFSADDLDDEWTRAGARPSADWLALLLRPGQEAGWWDERWAKRTGLRPADLVGIPTETVLDWLFPLQSDRNFVADLFHQTGQARRGMHATLHVLSQDASRPLPCTFLPVRTAAADATPPVAASADSGDAWLLILGEPSAPIDLDPGVPSALFARQFARGLGHLLNHYLSSPLGVAELALDRDDLVPEVAAWFAQILDGCRPLASLVAALQDLAADDLGETAVEALTRLVREVLDERARQRPADYELTTDLSADELPVRVNRRMLRVVLGHLLSNAEDALLDRPRRRITVRTRPHDDGVCCEIEDTGEGLATRDWTVALAPFYSRKGPFAHDAAHAGLPGMGLGLTVSQHLLALHGGRLELNTRPGEGTTARLVLPRATLSASTDTTEAVRVDAASAARGPHATPGLTSAVESG